MNKVYLLLRNNLQSGPYTIGELRQQNLQSTDLIWIEGESAAWCYPSEVEELNTPAGRKAMATATAVVPAMVVPKAVAAGKKSSPADEIEQQAEALRRRALSYTPVKPWQHYKPREERSTGPAFYRTEDDQIDIVFHKRERNYVPAQLLSAAMLTALCVTAWQYRDLLISVRPDVASVAAKAATFETVHPPRVQNAVVLETTPAVTGPVTETPAVQAVSQVVTTTPTVQKQQHEIINRAAPAMHVEQATIQPPKEEIIAAPQPIAITESKNAAAITVPETKEVPNTETVAAEPEKKKTLGQTIKGLFKKKKKEEEKPSPDQEQRG